MVAVPRMLLSDSSLRPSWLPARWPVRAAVALPAIGIALLFIVLVSGDLYRRLDKASMTERFGKAFERVGVISNQLRADWDLGLWAARPERPDLITLSLYINACTEPNDRVLVQSYLPQVLAIARRAFAGGHADLRPGFFEFEEAQRLTVERLRQRSVPIILLDTEDSLRSFYRSFPIITAYIDQEYRQAGMHTFDERFGLTLYVKKDRTPTGTYEPLGWPCFGSGKNAETSGGREKRRNAEHAEEQRSQS
jgi:hypothetical protein